VSDLDWLNKKGFRRIGRWTDVVAKLERFERLEREPGVYAFVVDGQLRYLGKATSLRSGLRGYNRSLKPETKRGFRKVHKRILETVMDGTIVEVWIWRHCGQATIGQREARWVAKRAPEWNVAGITAKSN
jgi:excinuclease UvrABC nuclease subunit